MEILAVVLAAVAAIVAVLVLVILLTKGKKTASVSAIDIEQASYRLKDELTQEIKRLESSNKAGNEVYANVMNNYIKSTETNIKELSARVEKTLKEVRDDNEKQLNKIRATVEEKLAETLDKRVEQAFKQVSDRLDTVQKGFGEMKDLTEKVGNLNKIFSNAKTRGNWGEVSLQSLLEQIFAPEQYLVQAKPVPNSKEIADFLIVMPGQASDDDVYLPIDAKFPLEDYQRLLAASDAGDNVATEVARKDLYERVKQQARSIKDKYVKPPHTTNFAVMYVPTEGLYAELLRDGSLISDLQAKYRVTVCGPTTVAALLNSLQLGFTTLKIQKKSSEIIKNMRAVKEDFAKFTTIIEKIRTRAEGVVKAVDEIEDRNRILTKKFAKLGDDVSSEHIKNNGGEAGMISEGAEE